MKTVLLQINNDKAYKLIKDLEALEIVKVIEKRESKEVKLSDKFAGKLNLSDEEYKEFHNSINQSRNEWERTI